MKETHDDWDKVSNTEGVIDGEPVEWVGDMIKLASALREVSMYIERVRHDGETQDVFKALLKSTALYKKYSIDNRHLVRQIKGLQAQTIDEFDHSQIQEGYAHMFELFINFYFDMEIARVSNLTSAQKMSTVAELVSRAKELFKSFTGNDVYQADVLDHIIALSEVFIGTNKGDPKEKEYALGILKYVEEQLGDSSMEEIKIEVLPKVALRYIDLGESERAGEMFDTMTRKMLDDMARRMADDNGQGTPTNNDIAEGYARLGRVSDMMIPLQHVGAPYVREGLFRKILEKTKDDEQARSIVVEYIVSYFSNMKYMMVAGDLDGRAKIKNIVRAIRALREYGEDSTAESLFTVLNEHLLTVDTITVQGFLMSTKERTITDIYRNDIDTENLLQYLQASYGAPAMRERLRELWIDNEKLKSIIKVKALDDVYLLNKVQTVLENVGDQEGLDDLRIFAMRHFSVDINTVESEQLIMRAENVLGSLGHAPAEIVSYAQENREELLSGGEARDDVANALGLLDESGLTKADLHRRSDIKQYNKAGYLLGQAERKVADAETVSTVSGVKKTSANIRALSRGLAHHDYKHASRDLLQLWHGAKTYKDRLRIVKPLVEKNNPKGLHLAAGLFVSTDSEKVKKYIAEKLFIVGYWDPVLKAYLIDSNGDYRVPLGENVPLRTLMEGFNLLAPNIDMYKLLEDEWETAAQSEAVFIERVAALKMREKQFDQLSHFKLLEMLAGDRYAARLYYLLHVGDYNYALVNRYPFDVFYTVVAEAARLELVPRDKWLVDKTPMDVISEMGEGERVVEMNIIRTLEDVESELEYYSERLKGVVGEELLHIVQSIGVTNESITRSYIAGMQSVNKVREFTAKIRQHEFIKIYNQSERSDGFIIAAYIMKVSMLSLGQRKPSKEQVTLFAEWSAHLDEVLESTEGLQREQKKLQSAKGGKRKRMEVTFLGKRDDFMRSLRFADSFRCCFSSKSGFCLLKRAPEWIARLNKDPMSFVIDVKVSGEDLVNGFVFGRMAIEPESNKPVVMLNGIYVQNRTPMMVDKLLRMIEKKIAHPIGASAVVLASKHGGTMALPSGYKEAEKVPLIATRAIMDNEVYDDIGTVAHGEFSFTGFIKYLK